MYSFPKENGHENPRETGHENPRGQENAPRKCVKTPTKSAQKLTQILENPKENVEKGIGKP